jgi:hypothetical protein
VKGCVWVHGSSLHQLHVAWGSRPWTMPWWVAGGGGVLSGGWWGGAVMGCVSGGLGVTVGLQENAHRPGMPAHSRWVL